MNDQNSVLPADLKLSNVFGDDTPALVEDQDVEILAAVADDNYLPAEDDNQTSEIGQELSKGGLPSLDELNEILGGGDTFDSIPLDSNDVMETQVNEQVLPAPSFQPSNLTNTEIKLPTLDELSGVSQEDKVELNKPSMASQEDKVEIADQNIVEMPSISMPDPNLDLGVSQSELSQPEMVSPVVNLPSVINLPENVQNVSVPEQIAVPENLENQQLVENSQPVLQENNLPVSSSFNNLPTPVSNYDPNMTQFDPNLGSVETEKAVSVGEMQGNSVDAYQDNASNLSNNMVVGGGESYNPAQNNDSIGNINPSIQSVDQDINNYQPAVVPIPPVAIENKPNNSTIMTAMKSMGGMNINDLGLAAQADQATDVNHEELEPETIIGVPNRDASAIPSISQQIGVPAQQVPILPERMPFPDIDLDRIGDFSPVEMIDQQIARLEAETRELKIKVEKIQLVTGNLKKEIEQKQYSAQVLDYALNSSTNRMNECEQQRQDLMSARSQILPPMGNDTELLKQNNDVQNQSLGQNMPDPSQFVNAGMNIQGQN